MHPVRGIYDHLQCNTCIIILSPHTDPIRFGLVVYKPLQNVTAYDGDTNVQFSVVAASRDPISLDYAITYRCPGSSLQEGSLSKQSTVLGILPGPVSTNDSGTVVRCRIFGSRDGIFSYTAILNVLCR